MRGIQVFLYSICLVFIGCGDWGQGGTVQARTRKEAITYQEVMEFLHPPGVGGDDGRYSSSDPHALRRLLGLDPVDPGKVARWSIYRDPPGEGISLDLSSAEGGGYRAIAFSRSLRSTEVLLFQQRGNVYRFTSALPGIDGDLGWVSFLDPAPGVLLLRVGYRIGSGTGCLSSGEALYLIEQGRGKELLSYSDRGYMVCGRNSQGYRVACSDPAETWPDLVFTCLTELYRDQLPEKKGEKPVWSRRSAIAATLAFTWDGARRELRYARENKLPEEKGRRLLENAERFLNDRIAAGSPLVERSTVAIPYSFSYGK